MNQEQLTSLVRQVLLAVGGGLVTKGYVDQGSWALIASGLATVIVASGWALYTRRTAGIVASAASLPDVKAVVTTNKLAAAIPADNVVATAAQAQRMGA